MNNLILFKLIIISNLKQEKIFSIISIIGIALGIGLYISVQSSTQKAIDSFKRDITSINQSSKYEIISSSGTFYKEDIINDLVKHKIFPKPLLILTGLNKNDGWNVKIVGIDLFNIQGEFSAGSNSIEADIYQFLTEKTAIILSKKSAEKLHLKKNDNISITVLDKNYRLTVSGILPNNILNEDIFIIDIASAQELFQLNGYISKLDIDDSRIELISSLIKDKGLEILLKEDVIKDKEKVVESFQYNLHFISFIAILVGFFTLYNTVFITVVKRRTQIGILKSIGMSSAAVLLFFVIQGVFLGIIGSIFGIILGIFLSMFSTAMAEKTISTFISQIHISNEIFNYNLFASAIILGILVSAAASFIPAYEASKIKPLESSKEGSFELRYSRYYVYTFWIGIISILLGIALGAADYYLKLFNLPYLTYIGVFIILIGFTLISPYYLITSLNIISKLQKFNTIFKPYLIISISNIRGSAYRFSITVITTAISTALIISMLILIHSFRTSLKDWINSNLIADVYIKPSSCLSNFCFEPLSKEVLITAKNIEGVQDINPFRVLKGKFNNGDALFGFGDVKVVRHYKDKENVDNYTIEKEVAISEYVSLKYGKKVGDYIEIPTPKGKTTFKIREVFNSYSTTGAFIIFDRKWLKDYWNADDFSQLSIHLHKSVKPTDFINNFNKAIDSKYSLEIMDGQKIKQKALDIFDNSFAITYAVQFIAFFVSLLGIMNTLTAVILEKQTEIATIRFIGGTMNFTKKMFLLSSAITGFFGIILGTLLGSLLSIMLIKVINTISFGWSIDIHTPFVYIFIWALVLYIVVILSSLIPIKLIEKINVKEVLNNE